MSCTVDREYHTTFSESGYAQGTVADGSMRPVLSFHRAEDCLVRKLRTWQDILKWRSPQNVKIPGYCLGSIARSEGVGFKSETDYPGNIFIISAILVPVYYWGYFWSSLSVSAAQRRVSYKYSTCVEQCPGSRQSTRTRGKRVFSRVSTS